MSERLPYCGACGQVFPNWDVAWAHYHSWEVPAQVAAIQRRQVLRAAADVVAYLVSAQRGTG